MHLPQEDETSMTQHHEVAAQAGQAPTMAPLIGAWRTEGEVFGEDGRTVVAAVAGSDVYGSSGRLSCTTSTWRSAANAPALWDLRAL